ncbi:SRPBCC family protein [Ilumatobacter nonamiensis]|uniref:SRPBCC family protein n=1 Tax=Ilumatobacter nonamiensis TaxID=467093 RepID=UPI0003481025|nr:SRPBCC family protein [Ilumatobacter nonamiensis]
MRIVRELLAPVSSSELFEYVGDLDAYPAWMPLVHDVERLSVAADDDPVWSVELRAKVGPFARSKRLRMRRTEYQPDSLAVFERSEDDERHHSPWVLRAELTPVDSPAEQTTLRMTLTYGGSLWAGPALERVLDDQVRRGSDALLELVV